MISILSYSQNMVIDGTSYIRLINGVKIVFNDVNPSPIQKIGNFGGIHTDSEESKIIFKSIDQIGEYQVPFASSQNNTIPFTFTIDDIGSIGEIHFSTWETSDDNLPYPVSVTAVNDITGLDNSNSVIDRFWSVDMVGYSDKPNGEFEFTYDDNDIIGNLITESLLYAQRWNSDEMKWGDWLYSPTANTITNKVNIFIQNPEDEYTIWTLVDQSDPLPIELVRLITNCGNNTIEWTTWTETNTSHIIVEGSYDGQQFQEFNSVSAAGNSNQPVSYSVSIEDYPYIRLRTIDMDGSSQTSHIIVNNCIEQNNDFIIFPNPTNGPLRIISNEKIFNIEIYDIKSKLVKKNTTNSLETLDISSFRPGIYIIVINKITKIKIVKL